ncbi:MAG: SpoIIE family protein phosphatase [Bacteroidales bacterium]|nr:SpoIIE family protein phosphatase [Bacteroidales bacterium]
MAVAVFLVLSAITKAQEGSVLLTHFNESRQSEDQNWAICQDSHNIMLFANRRGVITFDGYNWNLIRLPVIPYSMVYDKQSERVYIGGENGYGYLARNRMGIYEYTPVVPDSTFTGVVISMILTDSLLYVTSQTTITIHNLPELEIVNSLHARSDEPFSGIFSAAGTVFVSVWSKGLCRLDGDSLISLITGYMTAYDDILFVLPYDSEKVLIGLGSNSIHLFDGLEFYNWEADDEGYLSQNLVSGGHCINDTLYLFSTIEGGVVVAGRKSRKVYHIINYESGLPDNEIFAIGSDNNSGIWMSHEFGLTRADMALPVRDFSIYPGLRGNLITSLWHNNRLYVGTSDGLFFLDEVRRYENYEVLRRIPVRRQEQKETETSPALISQDELADNSQTGYDQGRRSIFDRIFGKKVTSEVVVATVEQSSAATPAPAMHSQTPQSYRYVKRNEVRLSSIDHEFRKVEGLEDKCKQLVGTPEGILIATNRGLYVARDTVAEPLVTGRYINRIGQASTEGRYFIVSNNGYFLVYHDGDRWRSERPFPGISRSLYSSVADSEGNMWFGAENSVLLLGAKQLQGPEIKEFKIHSGFIQRYIVENVRDTLFVLGESGVYYYDESGDTIKKLDYLSPPEGQVNRYILTENGEPWIIRKGIPDFLGEDKGWSEEDHSLLRLFDGITSIVSTQEAIWVTEASNRLFRFRRDAPIAPIQNLDLYISGTTVNEEPFFDLDRTEFERGHSLVQLTLVSPYYINQGAVQYRYRLSDITDGWSDWSSSPSLSLLVKPGSYTLEVMSRAITGVVSEIQVMQFRIRPRLTETTWFYLFISVFVIMAVYFVMKMRENKLVKDKLLLETKVTERTAEIAAQKQEITSSIEYASRIQHAMMPEESLFRKTFADHFILFRPRNIVSGDFYWIASEGGRVFFTAADCTGHGVPGAFMSMLGISALNDIINSDTTLSAATVLNLLRERIKQSLKQTGRQGEATDGIDMALCVFDSHSHTIEFSAAYNSMIHFRGAKITEYRGDRMPIGIFYGEKGNFTNHIIKLEKGDTIYLFTDGYADQFGGEGHTKYKIKNLKLLLSSVHDLPMMEQKRILEEEFDRWRGIQEQVDDITVIGIRV